jgi:hypothetical protein
MYRRNNVWIKADGNFPPPYHFVQGWLPIEWAKNCASVIRNGKKVAFANELVESLLKAKADAPGEKKLQSARDFLKNG